MVRTDQRFGYHHIKNILVGSRRKEVLRFNHHKLSTYGIGKEFSRPEWKQLYRELMKQDIIVRDIEHKSLKLTPKAKEILTGKQEVFGVIEEQERKDPVKTAKSEIESLDFDRELFKLLKEERLEIARKLGLAPYIIFEDTTLIEMAYYYPQSSEAFLKIHGVGNVKHNSYGEDFIGVIREYCGTRGLKERAKTAHRRTTKAKKAYGTGSRPYQVGRMFNDGKSIPEIAKIFDVKEATVVTNLTKYVNDGNTIPNGQLRELSTLSNQDFERVAKAFRELGTGMLRPIFEALNEEVSYEEIKIVQLWLLVNEQADVDA